jgi:hypothetical protein
MPCCTSDLPYKRGREGTSSGHPMDLEVEYKKVGNLHEGTTLTSLQTLSQTLDGEILILKRGAVLMV